MAEHNWKADCDYHNIFFNAIGGSNDRANDVHTEEIKTTPLFSADVLKRTLENQATQILPVVTLPQYGLLAKVLEVHSEDSVHELPDLTEPTTASASNGVKTEKTISVPEKMPNDGRLFVNMNAPWSAFICGSQGSGKSHTLSCMLENALISSQLGKLPHPLAGMVFHYDKFTSFSSTQVCEAAYLASAGISVKVLVSPSNWWRMKEVYSELPGFPANAKKPTVVPLLLHDKQLNVERMMKLMAVNEKDSRMSLYMEVRTI